MRCQGWGISALVAWSTFVLVACLPLSAAAQEPVGRAVGESMKKGDGEAVDEKALSRARQQVERALGRIQKRAAGDRTLKRLADEPAGFTDYGSHGFRLIIGGSTGDQIEVPMKGDAAPVKLPGHVSVVVGCSTRIGYGTTEDIHDGPYHGCVNWATSNPCIDVVMDWLTVDSDAPNRLAAIVREELDRENLRLLPTHKPKWPVVTNSERLSQLLPPDAPPAVTPRPANAPIVPKGLEGVFESPQDVVTAYNQAIANKDRRAYFRCLTPASQTYAILSILGYARLSESPELAKSLRKYFKNPTFADNSRAMDGDDIQDLDELWKGRSLARVDAPSDVWLCRLSEEAYLNAHYQRLLGDIPTFLADCMPLLQDWSLNDVEPLKCEGIRIEGDRAAGYDVIQPVPDPKKIEAGWNVRHYLPGYNPVHFLRIKGSWRIASMIVGDVD